MLQDEKKNHDGILEILKTETSWKRNLKNKCKNRHHHRPPKERKIQN